MQSVQRPPEFLRLLRPQPVDGGEIGSEHQLVPVVRGANQGGDRLVVGGERADAALQIDVGLDTQREHREQALARLLAAPGLAGGSLGRVGPMPGDRQGIGARVREMRLEVGKVAAEPLTEARDFERGRPLALQQGDAERHPILGRDVVSHASPS